MKLTFLDSSMVPSSSALVPPWYFSTFLVQSIFQSWNWMVNRFFDVVLSMPTGYHCLNYPIAASFFHHSVWQWFHMSCYTTLWPGDNPIKEKKKNLSTIIWSRVFYSRSFVWNFIHNDLFQILISIVGLNICF